MVNEYCPECGLELADNGLCADLCELPNFNPDPKAYNLALFRKKQKSYCYEARREAVENE